MIVFRAIVIPEDIAMSMRESDSIMIVVRAGIVCDSVVVRLVEPDSLIIVRAVVVCDSVVVRGPDADCKVVVG